MTKRKAFRWSGETIMRSPGCPPDKFREGYMEVYAIDAGRGFCELPVRTAERIHPGDLVKITIEVEPGE